VPQLRDVTVNQGLGSYSPLTWGKDTLVRLYMSQPSCASTGSLIQITGATLSVTGGGVATRTISSATPSLVSVFPTLATFNAAPAVDSTGDVKFDIPGSALSPAGTEAGFTAAFTMSLTYSAQPNSRTAPTTGSVTFTNRPGTTTPISAVVAKKTNALRVLVVPLGDPRQPYNTQLTAAGQAELERGMLTLARVFPVRDGIASLADTSATALAAGLRYSISPTLLDVSALMTAGRFCGNSANFATLRGLLAQFLQAFNAANPTTPADRVLGVGDQAVTNGVTQGCDDGRAAVNGNEAWARLIYDASGAPSRTGALMSMELAHTMGAVPAARNDGAFHSLYTNADYLSGDLNRAFNIATRSVLAGTSDDHTVMRFVSPWDNTNTVLEKADWALLLCRLNGPTTSDCATAGTVGSAAAGPAFVMSGTTSGSGAGLAPGAVGSAAGTNVVESYFSTSMPQTRPDPASNYHLVQKRNGAALPAPFGNQGVPVTATDTHHDNGSSQTDTNAGLFSVALPFDTSATRIELWRGTPGSGALIYARNTSAAPTVTSMTSGGILLARRAPKGTTAARPAKPATGPTGTPKQRPAKRAPQATRRALDATIYTVNSSADPGDGVCDAVSCTLRDAILAANANAGADTINFNVGVAGLQTIQPTTALPEITDQVTIDGTTQPGHTTTPIIEIDGTSMSGAVRDAIRISAGNSVVRGLVINRFSVVAAAGIFVSGGGNNTIEENYLGTNAAGDAAAGNWVGVSVNSGNNKIKGNLISGNKEAGIRLNGSSSAGTVVEGNYIGTTSTGDAALGVGLGSNAVGIFANGSSDDIIGGAAPGAGNLISGNGGSGVHLACSNCQVYANRIGVDAAGTAAVPNGEHGVSIGDAAAANTIGGSPAERNVISGNTGYGVFVNGGGSVAVANAIQNNYIGTNAAGTSGIANGSGGIGMVQGSVGSRHNLVTNNLVAHNSGPGVSISGAGSIANTLTANSIHSNSGLGIDLGNDGVTGNDASDADTGPNALQNFPDLTAATTTDVQGTLNSAPSTSFRLTFFDNTSCDASTKGEGETQLGVKDVTTDAAGTVAFAFTYAAPVPAGHFVTATATDFGGIAGAPGNTSEFSGCAVVAGGGGGGGGDGGPYVVNTTSNADDGTCDAADCSLREAINAANAHPNGDGADQITFAIPGSGPQQIAVNGSPLPNITEAVSIDGDTERTTGTDIPLTSKAIVLNGDGAGANANGLALATGSGGSLVKGLAIRDFPCQVDTLDPCPGGYGLVVESNGNTILGNFVGLTAEGTLAASNRGGGMLVDGDGNAIGGSTAADRNAIGGNAFFAADRSQFLVRGDGNTITGNYIGASADGATELNEAIGVTLAGGAKDNVLGGSKAGGRGNIILGRTGVVVADDAGTGNVVAGNDIGLDATGEVEPGDLPRVTVEADGTTVGDSTSPPGFANPDRGNVLVGTSEDYGLLVDGASGTKIAGNFIGTNRAGTAAMGNADGVRLTDTTGANTVGPGNTIAFNGGVGVSVGSTGKRIVANSIHDNEDVGIRNDSSFIAAPTLTRATKNGATTTVAGTFTGTPGSQFFIEFFRNSACDSSGAGEGETYIGFATATTNGSGSASFTFPSTAFATGDIVTATATSTVAPTTSEFSVCRQVVNSTVPSGQQPFDVGASDDNPQDDVLDLFLDCGPGKGKFPIAIALPAATSTATTANWSYNYDQSLACEGGELKAIVNDGFRQSGFSDTGSEPVDSDQKAPTSAILSPGKDATFLQYSVIPLKGLALDAEDGTLTPQWRLLDSSNAVVRTGSGTTKDLSPGTNGWAPGTYTVELSATDSGSPAKSTTSTVSITILADADNDGQAASTESGCLGGSDTDPLDAFGDKDGDGIPNEDDPAPCTAQTGAYTAVMTFQPNPFPIPSSGNTVNVTVQVPYRVLGQVQSSSVVISRINNNPVTFRNISWKVTNNVGQALFDRQALITYLMSHNIHNRTVAFTIVGSSLAPPWSFTGVATTVVSG
jgi:CSLREA domain-containing protein